MRGENKGGQRTCELVLEGSSWFPGDTLKVMYPWHCRNVAESIPIWREGRKGEGKEGIQGKGRELLMYTSYMSQEHRKKERRGEETGQKEG